MDSSTSASRLSYWNPDGNKRQHQQMKEYLQREWRLNVASKYQHLFETWFDNLTPNQILYYQAYSKGQKSPFTI